MLKFSTVERKLTLIPQETLLQESFHKRLFCKNHFTGTKQLAWSCWSVSLAGKRGMLVEMSSSKRIEASGQFEGS
jgi:hypothetical protein